MQVNIIQVKNAIDEAVDGLVTIGVLDPVTGNFKQPNVQQDTQIAALGVTVAETLGIDVPDKVENVIRMLPLIFTLVK